MKKLFMYLAVISITFNSYAQSPQKLSYQAVVRDVNGTLVQSHAVGIRIQILQTSEFGAAVYVETHSTSTNANGLLTLEIGGGTIVTGTFSGIDWSAGPYFIKTETDPTGGTSYTITGTSQILSVPYALHSKSSGNGFASVYSVTDFRPVLFANGNIGIGTSPNWAKLDVNGQLNIGPGQNTWGSQILINAASLDKGKEYKLTSTSGEGKLLFECTGKGTIMVMDSNLNVGIGISNPVSKLDVNGEINVNSNKITNVADPVNTNDAANKAYVDSQTPIHYIGESYGGGIVFYVYDNGKHGLIAATADQSTGIKWFNGSYTRTNTDRDGVGAGMYNTERIIANQGTGSYAAQLCANYQGGGYGDWYLPSKYELNLLYLQRTAVGGFSYYSYWSSSEYITDYAWEQSFYSGNQSDDMKSSAYYVRAIRAF